MIDMRDRPALAMVRNRMREPRLGGGVYLVDFGDRLKVGRSMFLKDRLAQHRAAGMLRFTVFCTDRDEYFEWILMRAMCTRAQQLGKSESFRGIEYSQAVELCRAALATAGHPEVRAAWSLAVNGPAPEWDTI